MNMIGRARAAVAVAALGVLSASAVVGAAPPEGGDAQTPIDIREADVTYLDRLPRIRFRYPSIGLDVINTGSPDHEATVRAVVGSPASIRLEGTTYRLVQFHFHAASEHRLDGEEFPMELHLVHQSDRGELLVVGVFVERGRVHRELQRIFRDLPSGTDDSLAVERFDVGALLPDDDSTYRYVGSLTTPPFTEGVRWIVFEEPIEMSRHQIATFQRLFPDGNSRDVQPLNGRQILSDVEDDD